MDIKLFEGKLQDKIGSEIYKHLYRKVRDIIDETILRVLEIEKVTKVIDRSFVLYY